MIKYTRLKRHYKIINVLIVLPVKRYLAVYPVLKITNVLQKKMILMEVIVNIKWPSTKILILNWCVLHVKKIIDL